MNNRISCRQDIRQMYKPKTGYGRLSFSCHILAIKPDFRTLETKIFSQQQVNELLQVFEHTATVYKKKKEDKVNKEKREEGQGENGQVEEG